MLVGRGRWFPDGGSGASGGEAAAEPPRSFKGTVVDVADGDTLDVTTPSGAVETVRIIGIDTPEVYGGRECGGPAASAAMKQLATGATVTVTAESDPGSSRSLRAPSRLHRPGQPGPRLHSGRGGWHRPTRMTDRSFGTRVTAGQTAWRGNPVAAAGPTATSHPASHPPEARSACRGSLLPG